MIKVYKIVSTNKTEEQYQPISSSKRRIYRKDSSYTYCPTSSRKFLRRLCTNRETYNKTFVFYWQAVEIYKENKKCILCDR